MEGDADDGAGDVNSMGLSGMASAVVMYPALVENDELLRVLFFMDLYLLVIWFIYLLGKALTGSFGGIAKEAIRFEFATDQRVIPDSGFLYTAGLGSVREERRSH